MVLYKVKTILVTHQPMGKKLTFILPAGMLPASWKMQVISHQPDRKKLTFHLPTGTAS